jgi:hypothetical protein
MTLREQIEQRRRQWEAFNRWEEQQPPLEREPGQILADLGAILRWIPEEDRLHTPTRRRAACRFCWQRAGF